MQTEFSQNATYEIGKASTDNSNNASVIASGPASVTSATLGPYPSGTGSPRVFVWVRQKLANGTASPWVANLDNAIVVPGGC